MKIGIPRAGLYYKFFPLWDTFFKEIGIEPIYSPPTNEALLKKGIEFAHSDICFPMKVFFGHTWWLRDKVDLLFVPRVISIEPKKYLCPKFIGLPDMLKCAIPDLPPLLDVNFNIKNEPIVKSWQTIGKKLGISANKVKIALTKAIEAQANYRWNKRKDGNGLRIGIIGRPYITYDGYISAELIKRLETRNISVWTIEDLPPEVIYKALSILKKPIYFEMGEQNVGTAFYFLSSNKIQLREVVNKREPPLFVDGFIYLISFDCGPDSLLKELIDDYAKGSRVPYTTLILDEHTGIAGIMTRVEAFLDMVQYRKKI